MSKIKKSHWEKVYEKESGKFSWNQNTPSLSMEFINSFNLSKSSSIIDIGGGDSKLVDCLLEEGFENITVLDISNRALKKKIKRLENKADKVKWIVSDILDLDSDIQYDLWHDRATFHFLTKPEDVRKYIETAIQSTKKFLTIGTFSENGPNKCSGLGVKQYSEEQLKDTLAKGFKKIRCITEDHITPSDVRQNFLFCSFKRI